MLDSMTFPQVLLYLDSFVKRKTIEADAIDEAVANVAAKDMKEMDTMKDSDLSDFGLGHRQVKRGSE